MSTEYQLMVGTNSGTDVNCTLDTPGEAVGDARAFRAACPNVPRVHIAVIDRSTGELVEMGYLHPDHSVSPVPYWY